MASTAVATTKFRANAVADLINDEQSNPNSPILRAFLFGDQPPTFRASAKGVGKRLRQHVDNPVKVGSDDVMTLKAEMNTTDEVADADAAGGTIGVEVIEHDADAAGRGVIGGGHAAEFGRGELRAVDRGAVQQDEFVVWWGLRGSFLGW